MLKLIVSCMLVAGFNAFAKGNRPLRAASRLAKFFEETKIATYGHGRNDFHFGDYLNATDADVAENLGELRAHEINTLMLNNGVSLPDVAAYVGQLVTDLEAGGPQLAQDLRANPQLAGDVAELLQVLFSDEEYRYVQTERPLEQRHVNVFTQTFPEPLNALTMPLQKEYSKKISRRDRIKNSLIGLTAGSFGAFFVYEAVRDVDAKMLATGLGWVGGTALLAWSCGSIIKAIRPKSLLDPNRFNP